MKRGVLFHIPLNVATTPHEGHCFVNRWWSVHPEKGVAFYARTDEPSPQCNTSEHVARILTAKLYPDHEVQFLPAVYLLPATREMVRLKKQALDEHNARRAAASA